MFDKNFILFLVITLFLPPKAFALSKNNDRNKPLAVEGSGVKSILLPMPVRGWLLENLAGTIVKSIISDLYRVVVRFINRVWRNRGSSETYMVKINNHDFDPNYYSNWVGDNKMNKMNRVEDLQVALTKLKFDPGRIDGYWGPETKRALKDMQAWYRIKEDGLCGPETWITLSKPLS